MGKGRDDTQQVEFKDPQESQSISKLQRSVNLGKMECFGAWTPWNCLQWSPQALLSNLQVFPTLTLVASLANLGRAIECPYKTGSRTEFPGCVPSCKSEGLRTLWFFSFGFLLRDYTSGHKWPSHCLLPVVVTLWEECARDIALYPRSCYRIQHHRIYRLNSEKWAGGIMKKDIDETKKKWTRAHLLHPNLNNSYKVLLFWSQYSIYYLTIPAYLSKLLLGSLWSSIGSVLDTESTV